MTWFNTLTDERPALLTLAIFVPVRATLADDTEIRGVVIDHGRTNGSPKVSALVVDVDDLGEPLEIPEDQIVVDLATDAGFLHALGCYTQWRRVAPMTEIMRIEDRWFAKSGHPRSVDWLLDRSVRRATSAIERECLAEGLVAASRSSD